MRLTIACFSRHFISSGDVKLRVLGRRKKKHYQVNAGEQTIFQKGGRFRRTARAVWMLWKGTTTGMITDRRLHKMAAVRSKLRALVDTTRPVFVPGFALFWRMVAKGCVRCFDMCWTVIFRSYLVKPAVFGVGVGGAKNISLRLGTSAV